MWPVAVVLDGAERSLHLGFTEPRPLETLHPFTRLWPFGGGQGQPTGRRETRSQVEGGQEEGEGQPTEGTPGPVCQALGHRAEA